MITRNDFFRRHTVGSADDSICLHCFLTVSAVQGGANLREMEMRHKCDPRTMIRPRKAHEVVVSIGHRFRDYISEERFLEGYLSAPNAADAEREKILQRLKKYGRKQGLAIIKRAGNSASG